MKRRSLVFTPLLALAALLFIAACGGAATIAVNVDAPTTTIAIDGRTQLSATVTGTSNTGVTWSTGNAAIATVDSNGIVEANGVAGSASITATSVADPTKSDSVSITVGTFSVTGVTISAPATSVAVGNTIDLDATVSPAGVPQEIIWSSGSTGVATIDGDGVVTGVAAGTTTITARAAADTGASATIVITVFDSGGGGNVTSVTINDPNPSGPDQVQVGGTLDLTVDVVADPGVSQSVTWSSGDDSIATVDSNGLVTGVAAGTVTITATSVADSSVSDDIAIQVIAGTVTDVTITNRPSGNTLLVGVNRDLDANVSGTGNFSQDVIWTSSAPGVATIDSDGVVTGVAQGTTVITAIAASDTNVDDSFTLTVSEVNIDCSNPTGLTDVTTDTDPLPLGCYEVASGNVVDVDALLRIQPGTIIEFGQGSRLRINPGGTVDATGTSTEPITLRGTNPSTGFWDGVEIGAVGANVFANVMISDAGDGGWAGIYLQSTGSVSLRDTTISNSAIGLVAEGGGELSQFQNNTFSGNTLVADIGSALIGSLDAASDYAGSSGTANTDNYIAVNSGDTGDGDWPAANVPFRIDGGAILDVDGAVTIAPGATLEFGAGARLRTEDGGTIDASGTAGAPIVFRGATSTTGFWDGIQIQTPTNVFDNVEISDAGDGGYAGLYMTSGAGSASITNTTFASNEVGLFATGGELDAFASNTFVGNELVADIAAARIAELDAASDYAGTSGTANINNYIAVNSGNAGAGTWPATNAPFRVDSGAILDVDGTVTVSPGAVFEFAAGARLRTEGAGILDASGTTTDPIVFRGFPAAAGTWDGIQIQTPGNTLDYVTVSDGGDGGYADLYISSGSVTVTNSAFNSSATFGIDLVGGSITPGNVADLKDPAIGNNTFSGNASGETDGIPAN